MEILIGALISGLVEVIKKYLGSTPWVTRFILAVFSLVAAGIYYTISYFGYWETFYKIILSAGAIYAFVIRPLTEKLSNK